MPGERVQELLVDGLRELYDAEKQLVRAIPKMARAAESDQLRRVFNEHLEATRRQAERLERAFQLLGAHAKSRPCKGMRGIIEEGEEHLGERFEQEGIDSVLIGGGQKVEHYEIAGYTSALELAGMMGNRQVSRLLQQTLAEEQKMERKLAQLSPRLLKTIVRQAA